MRVGMVGSGVWLVGGRIRSGLVVSFLAVGGEDSENLVLILLFVLFWSVLTVATTLA